jgi:GntR family transcriptional repressor for pyruvate dehydrogenase complex
MFNAEPVRKRRLYEQVVEQIEASILAGKLKPGDLLPAERELCESFGVSRTAVREALFALQQNGLIELENGKRARVIEPSAARLIDELSGPARFVMAREDRLKQLQQARVLFESFLARNAAREATPEDIERIGEALERNKASVGDRDAFVATNVEFHLEIARASKNIFFDALHTTVQKWLEEHRRVVVGKPGATELAAKRHQEIFDAIKAHNPDAAEEAMRRHLGETTDTYWSQKDVG